MYLQERSKSRRMAAKQTEISTSFFQVYEVRRDTQVMPRF
ncbi:hypothetical protein HMPREF1989_00982 [Porphyromonas gingivalis F0566]|nr:hypothetical protein HMPREF1989_00982 [Porphyromonas gingivalis F0566]